MQIVARGVLHAGQPPAAVATFPTVTWLPPNRLLATYRVGAAKDGDDETVECRWSEDGGSSWSEPWRPFATEVGGVAGSLKVVYVTSEPGSALLAAALWVDRSAHPGKPLFNEATQGCLPLRVLLAESGDQGRTWSPWRVAPTPETLGPPSLTSPILLLPSGRMALSLESNKTYLDPSPWLQHVQYLYSRDRGRSWPEARRIVGDLTGRYFHWDQRAAVAPDGRIVSFTWLYDSRTGKYLPIERRISVDEGANWSRPERLGFADQPSRPAIFPDGRVLLAWVDRFGSHTIRAAVAPSLEGPFSQETLLYDAAPLSGGYHTTGELLMEQISWTYGLPYVEPLPDGDAMVVYYAGDAERMDIHWVRLRPE